MTTKFSTKNKVAKSTGSMTKKDYIPMLMDALPMIEELDESLYERVDYTTAKAIEDINKVPKSELATLYAEVKELLDSMEDEDEVVETSPKPQKSALKVLPKSEPVAEPKTAKSSKAKKPEAKKPDAKKPEVKKPGASKAPAKSAKDSYYDLMVKTFPPVIEERELGTLKRVDDITTMDELRKALNEDERNLYFCGYWDKKLVRQYSYAKFFEVDNTPVFPLNLDITQALYVCDSMDRVYAVSTYTEAIYKFFGDDLALVFVESEDGDDAIPVRYSNGMEFAIYEQ